MGFFGRRKRGESEQQVGGDDAGSTAGVSGEMLRSEARRAIVPGFLTKADAVERVRGVLELPDEDHRVEHAVEEVWNERLAEQAAWSGPSDYERLQLAFDDLGGAGVVARMNFACCNTCGTEEIDDERTPLEVEESYPFREKQYTFFHQQDSDRLADERATLHLTYSAWRPSDDLDPALRARARDGDGDARAEVIALTDAAAGQRVSAALRERGLDVVWDGNPNTRIAVQILDWRKPLPA